MEYYLATFSELLLFALVVSIFISSYLLNRKGKIKDIRNYEKVSFSTSLRAEKAFIAILKGINSSTTIDDIDEDQKQIVVSDKYDLLTGGNYYSVSCNQQGSETSIEIGIKSKSWGRTEVPFSRFVNLIRAAIIIEK
jgi:hypothetical protein